jgi:hypothetical protein
MKFHIGCGFLNLYSIHYYDLTGAKGVAKYDACNQIDARDRFLAQHPNCNINYIELKTESSSNQLN